MSALVRMRQEILADKRKSAFLAGLALLAVVMGGRAVLSSSGSKPGRPATASAATNRPASGQGGTTARPVAQDAKSASEAEKRLREFMSQWGTSQTTSVARDLFALDSAHFPDPAQADRRSAGGVGGAKSATGSDDDGLDTAARLRDLARLQLKSVMSGNRTIAIFDLSALGGSPAAIVREGDIVGGFTVTNISARSVTLALNGQTYDLRVSSPLDD